MITIGMILIMSAASREGNLTGFLWLVMCMLLISSLLDIGMLFLASVIFG